MTNSGFISNASDIIFSDGETLVKKIGSVEGGLANHTHTKSQITDFPSAIKNPTALTLSLNGGATEGTNKFTYDGAVLKNVNITPISISAADRSHTHVKSDITNFPESLKNPNVLTIQCNGSTKATYDGAETKIVNITTGDVGAAPASHGTHVSYGTNIATLVAGGASVAGSSATLARSDHRHAMPAYPTALKNPTNLVIYIQKGDVGWERKYVYDGSTYTELNITPSTIHAADASHTHNKIYYSSSNGNFDWYINSNGNFIPREYIGDTSSTRPANIGTTGEGYVAKMFYQTLQQVSDRRKKENIKEITAEKAYDIVMSITPTSFNYKADKNKIPSYGIIAQDYRDYLIKNNKKIDGILHIGDVESGDDITDLEYDEDKVSYTADYVQLITPTVRVVQDLTDRVTYLEDILRRVLGKIHL